MRMKKTWNQHQVKKQNKSLILETIMKNFPISRADIANQTGLNKGTVSSLVNDLLVEELIYESGPGKSSGGRRPVMLLFNQLAGCSIGIDLGVNYLLGVLTDLNGNILHQENINFNNLTYEEIIDHLFKVIDLLVKAAPSTPYGIIGIGIGVPGIVRKDGEVLLAPNLNWKNVQLKSIIEETYNVPVIIENEANAGAYGEKKFGVGKNFNNIVYVSVGIGIGVGLILNRKLYKGNSGFSGEMGHMTINVNGDKCRCGNIGCWELYASEQALVKNAERLGIKPVADEELSLDSLIKLAENEDENTINLFAQIGDYIGVGINSIINTFNPEQIIIGNRMASARQWVSKSIKTRIVNQAMDFHQQDFNLNFSKLTTHSSALGAAAFSIENFFQNEIRENPLQSGRTNF